MTLYEMPNFTSGIDTGLVQTQATVPIFTPMFLTFVFGVVLLGGMIAQNQRKGYIDLPYWLVMASISTLMVALPMTLIEGLIDIVTLGIIVALVIVFGLWFFLDRS